MDWDERRGGKGDKGNDVVGNGRDGTDVGFWREGKENERKGKDVEEAGLYRKMRGYGCYPAASRRGWFRGSAGKRGGQRI